MATTSIGEARIRRSSRRWWLLVAIAAILAAAIAYACVPRQADLTAFGAESLARRETALWREYYEKRYLALARDIYDVSRLEYNFSPLDSVRIAVAAASAARTFQPSTSRAEAEAALPALTTYFRILASGAKIKVDVEDAARTELAWWQARREEAGPDQVGLIVARVATLLYGVDGDDVRRSGILRARAMAYRDARGAAITDADWAMIEDQLRTAYGLFEKALESSPRR